MALYGQVEAPQSVPRETVRPALENNCTGLEVAHYVANYVFEDVHERVVVDSLTVRGVLPGLGGS